MLQGTSCADYILHIKLLTDYVVKFFFDKHNHVYRSMRAEVTLEITQ